MHKLCAQTLENLRTLGGKICVRLSTDRNTSYAMRAVSRVKLVLNHTFSTVDSPGFYTPVFLPLPLSEYKFYTLSTEPINTTTSLLKEER